MRKLTGYIPIEGEITQQSLAEDKAVKIAGVWHKPAEVWVQGVTEGKPERPIKPTQTYLKQPFSNLCDNCGEPPERHLFMRFCKGTKFNKKGGDVK